MEYQLNVEAAKQADIINSRIDTRGKYLGMLTRAEPIKSKKGSQGVDMSFKADTGATADYLTIWTHNADGKQLQGFNALMAIMTCMRVKSLKAEVGEIEKYDQDQQKRVNVSTPIFKELMNKPFGLVLHMEEYEKTAGGTAWKPAISGVFDKDEFTASEILNKSKEPGTLNKMLDALRDRPLKAGGQANKQSAPSSIAPDSGPFSDMADDIPF